MLQPNYLQISLAVIIFLAGFTCGRWLFNDTSNNPVLAHSLSVAPHASAPQRRLEKSCEAEVSIAHEDNRSAPKNTHQLAQQLSPASCDQECIKQQINALFERGFGNSGEDGMDLEQYSPLLLRDITQHLAQDNTLLAEFEGKLMEQIAAVSEYDGQKSEAVLAMAYHLPEKDRTRIAWQIAQSYQDPGISKLAFELLPDDAQLHAHLAINAMTNILSGDSAESLSFLQHVVSYGSDLSQTTLVYDLENWHTTTQDQFQRDAALSLLGQINPYSQAFKDTLAASLDSEPREVVSALRTLARASRHPAVYRSADSQSASNPGAANHERIQSLANDPTTPIDVRIASLEALKAFNRAAR